MAITAFKREQDPAYFCLHSICIMLYTFPARGGIPPLDLTEGRENITQKPYFKEEQNDVWSF